MSEGASVISVKRAFPIIHPRTLDALSVELIFPSYKIKVFAILRRLSSWSCNINSQKLYYMSILTN